MDVKTRTMLASKRRSSSAPRQGTPRLSERMERLATPKSLSHGSAAASPRASGSRTYAPHKGKYAYVDTTRMTDAELARHKQQMASGSSHPDVSFG